MREKLKKKIIMFQFCLEILSFLKANNILWTSKGSQNIQGIQGFWFTSSKLSSFNWLLHHQRCVQTPLIYLSWTGNYRLFKLLMWNTIQLFTSWIQGFASTGGHVAISSSYNWQWKISIKNNTIFWNNWKSQQLSCVKKKFVIQLIVFFSSYKNDRKLIQK